MSEASTGMVELEFHHALPFAGRDELIDVRAYGFPHLERFDFEQCQVVVDAPSEDVRNRRRVPVGVDILDPVQVSARNMDLDRLNKDFGRHICLHGGLDSQTLLTCGTPEEIRQEVRRARRLYENRGGLILGPSHYLTTDVPLENILAVYRNRS